MFTQKKKKIVRNRVILSVVSVGCTTQLCTVQPVLLCACAVQPVHLSSYHLMAEF